MRRHLMTPFMAAALACGGTGLGKNVRADVEARMASAQGPISSCYEEALKRDRKLRGLMVLTFEATPKTGAFENVQVTRSDLPDEALQRCVTEKVAALKLEKPQKAKLAVEYPINFTPGE